MIFVCFVVSKYVSPTAHFSIQWCIPIGKWLSQVSKTITLTTYKGKQLKWRCRNDATIPKVELWFQLWHCWPTLKWFILLSWWHSHQKIVLELKIANPSEVTTHFKVSTSDYLPPNSTFFKVLKYSTYIAWLEKITKQHKTYLYVTRTIKLRFS